jgi:iron complex outermembrane recepter protein
LTTTKVIQATTDAEGQFVFTDVPSDPQLVTIEKSGFESFAQGVSPTGRPSTAINASLNVATLSESVVVRGTVDPEAKPMPTREDVMVMLGTVRVLDRKQLDAAGPLAGGAQMLQSTPRRQRGWLWRDRGDEIHRSAQRNPAGLVGRGDKFHSAGFAWHHL